DTRWDMPHCSTSRVSPVARSALPSVAAGAGVATRSFWQRTTQSPWVAFTTGAGGCSAPACWAEAPSLSPESATARPAAATTGNQNRFVSAKILSSLLLVFPHAAPLPRTGRCTPPRFTASKVNCSRTGKCDRHLWLSCDARAADERRARAESALLIGTGIHCGTAWPPPHCAALKQVLGTIVSIGRNSARAFGSAPATPVLARRRRPAGTS